MPLPQVLRRRPYCDKKAFVSLRKRPLKSEVKRLGESELGGDFSVFLAIIGVGLCVSVWCVGGWVVYRGTMAHVKK